MIQGRIAAVSAIAKDGIGVCDDRHQHAENEVGITHVTLLFALFLFGDCAPSIRPLASHQPIHNPLHVTSMATTFQPSLSSSPAAIMPIITASESASRRRQTRLRREYLYRKSLEGKEKHEYEQKRQVRQALAEGKPLPTEVRAAYDKLKTSLDQDDIKTGAEPKSHVDDEYAEAGWLEPRVCVTTSRDPSSRLKQFCKEIKLLFPNSTRINRGNNRVDELMESCRHSSFTDLVIVQETRGEPDGMVICHLPMGPTAFFSLHSAVLRHDLDPPAAPMSEANPHVILHNFHSPLGRRVGNILKCLFPIPRPDSQRVVTLANQNDFISFRQHMYSKVSHDKVQLHEVGPRFEMKLYQIRLGTLEQREAENEYVLRPYQNTASKRQVL
jgi:U3 small nucleolar ribonucleoprotein protein IMP4